MAHKESNNFGIATPGCGMQCCPPQLHENASIVTNVAREQLTKWCDAGTLKRKVVRTYMIGEGQVGLVGKQEHTHVHQIQLYGEVQGCHSKLHNNTSTQTETALPLQADTPHTDM